MLQRLPADFHVTLLGKKVTPSPSARDLGLQVDSTLSYDEHVTQTVSSCIGSLCQINRVKHLFEARTLERVIDALVFSYTTVLRCGPTLQRKISRSCRKFRILLVESSLKIGNLTIPVTSFLKYTLGVLAFKCVKGLAPSYLCPRFKTRACVHDCKARYKNNLNISAYKSASGQRTYLYREMSFWNSLPREIRECDNLPIFKRHLKEFLSSF